MFETRGVRDLTDKELLLVPAELNLTKICLYCSKKFSEVNNFGRLACRLHPGIILEGEARFSCCQQHVSKRGCRRVDHSSEKISIEDEMERHHAIYQESVIVIPSAYFYYGILPPLPETILYHHRSSSSSSSKERKNLLVTYKMPFNESLVQRFDIEQEVRQLRKKRKKLPILAHHHRDMTSKDLSNSRRMANQGWRDDISPNTNITMGGDSDDDDGDDDEKDLHNLLKIDIPFVIIKRVV